MNKNNKGFTFIELLVTIALMLSLLVIAIVSFINLSNKKKEEAYEDVKKQVEQAAEQFFGTNNYYISDLENNNANSYARISLGRLVKEDYLNSVTNPVTGNKLSYCNYVDVQKINGSYVYTYNDVKDDSKTCDNLNYITVTEPGAPSLEIHTYGKAINAGNKNVNDYKGWYTSKVTVSATVDTSGNGEIQSIKYCNTVEDYCEPTDSPTKNGNKYEIVYDKDGSKLTTVYKVTNLAGKSVTTSISYMIDKVNPTCDVSVNKTVSSTGWFNKSTGKPTITFSSEDATSRVKGNSSVAKNAVEGDKTYSWTFTDNAGNSNSCSTTIKYDGQAPTGNLKVTSTNEKYNSNKVNVSGEIEDATSGLKSYNFVFGKYDSKEASIKNALKSQKINFSDITIYSKLDKKTYTGYMVVTDVAGNTATITTDKYTIYKDCSNKIVKTTYGDYSTCSKACGAGDQIRTKTVTYTDSKTGNQCSKPVTTNESRKCNTDGCCSSTKQSIINNPNFGECGPKGKKSKTVTYKLTSRYNGQDCGTTTKTITEDCKATNCETAYVYTSDTNCLSDAKNEISARLKIQCNGPIDYVEVKYYYPDADYSDCHGNDMSRPSYRKYSTDKETPEMNGAVFNFRGCGVNTVTYKYKVQANGKIIHNYDDTDWKNYDFTSAENTTNLCKPEKGSHWFK